MNQFTDQSYSTKSLLRLMSRSDPRRYPLGRDKNDYLDSITFIKEQIDSDSFQFKHFNVTKRNGKPVYLASTVADVFALRKLSDNLAKCYSIKQSDRHAIISQSLALLNEKVAFYVTRRDVKDFFESVDRTNLIKRIQRDQLLCYRSRQHLTQLFGDENLFSCTGLPRGLGVSSVLSEMYLSDFDKVVRRTDGVYFYARYVDDIIIFSRRPPESFLPQLEEYLLNGLGLQFSKKSEKANDLCFDTKGICTSPITEVSYLGYRFLLKTGPAKSTKTEVRIAQSKRKSIKTRIMMAISEFLRTSDYTLLKDRLSILTGNYVLRSDNDNRRLMSGIFYNYSLIDNSGKEELKSLTRFLTRAIHARHGSFGRKMRSKLTDDQRKELAKYCFHTGFDKRITKNFSEARLGEINSCWTYG